MFKHPIAIRARAFMSLVAIGQCRRRRRVLVSVMPEKGQPLPGAKESKVILYFHVLSTNQSSAISVESYLCLSTGFK